jgi:hypothetical protein
VLAVTKPNSTIFFGRRQALFYFVLSPYTVRVYDDGVPLANVSSYTVRIYVNSDELIRFISILNALSNTNY